MTSASSIKPNFIKSRLLKSKRQVSSTPIARSSNLVQRLQLAFDKLARRDQLALLALLGFLLVFGLGFGGWTLHEKAQKTQKEYDTAVADLFWLRSQAANISSMPTQSLAPADSVKQILSQAGITAQVVDNAGKIQLGFSHSQASVIANILAQLNQQGFMIEQLQITQPTLDKLEVQAVISKTPI